MNTLLNFIILDIDWKQEIIGTTYFLIFIVIPVAGIWKLFQKAGKPGWAIIVPIYGQIIFLEVIGKPWWWIFLYAIPYLNLIWIIWSLNLMVKSFGKNEIYTIGAILLGFIFIPMLGFGKAEYIGPAGLNYKKQNLAQ